MMIVKIAASMYLMLATVSFTIGFTMPSAMLGMIARVQTRILQPALTEVVPGILSVTAAISEIEWWTT
jgi:hypothetical protein